MPALRNLLEKILPDGHGFENFEVDHIFPSTGHVKMLLNARRTLQTDSNR